MWNIHNGNPPGLDCPLTFGMLQNLASVANANDPKVLWGFISRYVPGATAEKLAVPGPAGHVRGQLLPGPGKAEEAVPRRRRHRTRGLGRTLRRPSARSGDSTADGDPDRGLLRIGKRHPFPELKDWFKGIYAVLFGQSEWAAYGFLHPALRHRGDEAVIDDALAGKFLNVRFERLSGD